MASIAVIGPAGENLVPMSVLISARQHSGGTDDGNISFPGFLSPGGTHLAFFKGLYGSLGRGMATTFLLSQRYEEKTEHDQKKSHILIPREQ